MDNIYLCGFMGAGKTTVAKALAKKNGVSYCDTDDLITTLCGLSIPEIFSRYGEAYFREMETKALRETQSLPGAVIATGGGLVLNPKNVELIREYGTLLYLDTPFSLCYERIHGDQNRPNAAARTKDELFALYREREAVYRKASCLIIPCGNDLEETLRRIEQVLNK
ncbi:shikimate kinase [Massiliimalia massiliensis]|uniref:shikimate kinase n=1 Tax=Massiliimalia massiliensis TaxID=1852384 RepID=UPI0009872ABF|nr:shikimate kinase [Massiliimalia massiliensis]